MGIIQKNKLKKKKKALRKLSYRCQIIQELKFKIAKVLLMNKKVFNMYSTIKTKK